MRTISSIFLVAILEELFWRGWMMRWLIDKDFDSIPLGRYTALSFWAVAVLFAPSTDRIGTSAWRRASPTTGG